MYEHERSSESQCCRISYVSSNVTFFSVGAAIRNSNLEANLRKLKAAPTTADTDTASDKIHFATYRNRVTAEEGSCFLSLRRPGFDRRPLHVGFVVDEVEVAHVYLVFVCPYDCDHGPYLFVCHRRCGILAADSSVTHSKPGGYHVYHPGLTEKKFCVFPAKCHVFISD
jgi:hypothetical protein